MSCVKIPQAYKTDNHFMKNWICMDCNPTVFPFAKIDNKKIVDISNHNLEKYSRDNLSADHLTKTCNICSKDLSDNNKGIPCSSCKCKIHIKCAKVNPKTFHEYRGNWQCEKCIYSNIPFTMVDNQDLTELLAYNSIVEEKPKKFQPVVNIEEKVKLMLSYSKQSPWYAYTHPNEQEHDFFTAEFEESMTMRPNFDYYDIDQFRKTKKLWNKNNSLGIFHTNMCSLQANINNLEDLLHDLDYSFDVIALTETWNPEKSKDSFSPKKLEGYLDYHGTTGSSLKGGCGFYVKDTFTPIPRNDLEFKISETGKEAENCWIELINTAGPNIIIGVFYRHPSRYNDLFIDKLKVI